MRGDRFKHTLRLFMISSAVKRADYLRKNGVFAGIGEGCIIMSRVVPLYSNLIRLGRHVILASNVQFITHDITHVMLNHLNDERISAQGGVLEKVGCIDIGDNVFVGAGTRILYNVRIGSNVIIGANSLVIKDIPDNCVVAGTPARVISTLDEYIDKRLQETTYPKELAPIRESIKPELIEWCWKQFDMERV